MQTPGLPSHQKGCCPVCLTLRMAGKVVVFMMLTSCCMPLHIAHWPHHTWWACHRPHPSQLSDPHRLSSWPPCCSLSCLLFLFSHKRLQLEVKTGDLISLLELVYTWNKALRCPLKPVLNWGLVLLQLADIWVYANLITKICMILYFFFWDSGLFTILFYEATIFLFSHF